MSIYSGTLNGGNGNDTLTSDFSFSTGFVFNAPTEGVDSIVNFGGPLSDSSIDVSASGFGGGLTPGAATTPEQFRLGSSAGDAR